MWQKAQGTTSSQYFTNSDVVCTYTRVQYTHRQTHVYMKTDDITQTVTRSLWAINLKHVVQITTRKQRTSLSVSSAPGFSLWLRAIMRRYEWQRVFITAHSLSLPPHLSLSLSQSQFQSALLIPQCPGINADDTQPFEGCVLVRLKPRPSSGSRRGESTPAAGIEWALM